MRRTNKLCYLSISIILVVITYVFIAGNFFNISLSANQNISSDINSLQENLYPGIKEKIQNLQTKYPNWKFKIFYTDLDWSDVIANEYTGHGSSPRNLVQANSSYDREWICSICGNKVYDTGNWVCASEKAIKYMMDPRNSLNENDIFQFEELTNNGANRDTLKSMLSGSFLDDYKYVDCIINAGKINNVNPYYLAARILQEQGKNGSYLSRGQGYNGQYVGYYNLFNIGATGGSEEKVVLNGLAKAQKEGWTSIEKSIEGGSKFVAESYIAKGQNTLYLQKFDVDNTSDGLYWHQYMQNIMAAQSEGSRLKSTYESINAVNSEHTFIIPVYRNMLQTASPRPNSGEIDTSITELVRVNVISNIYLRDSPNGNKTGKLLYKDEIVTRLEKAEEKVGGTYWDKVLKANGEVGYVARQTFDYESTYKLYLIPIEENNSSGNTNNSSDLKKGDVNGDGNITSSDYVLIKNYIMGTGSLDENAKKSADYNEDGSITSSDYVLIKNYIMSN